MFFLSNSDGPHHECAEDDTGVMNQRWMFSPVFFGGTQPDTSSNLQNNIEHNASYAVFTGFEVKTCIFMERLDSTFLTHFRYEKSFAIIKKGSYQLR